MKVAQAKIEMIKSDEINMEEYEVSTVTVALLTMLQSDTCLVFKTFQLFLGGKGQRIINVTINSCDIPVKLGLFGLLPLSL